MNAKSFVSSRPHSVPAIIAAVMLLAALGKWPYDYYKLLRWVCAINAAHSSATHPGDFETYVLRNAIKDSNTGRLGDALDGPNFLRHWQGIWRDAGICQHANPKVEAFHRIATTSKRRDR